ncbi:malate dehydrogenase, mitochondrial precursor [Purpureocillium lavendulum]|uniref:malate dehydrogenase n=1 Tax=Purpureocillium lavendulum TaxID=1247861 RepID=A0AB34FM37_9HYPO|nr:malate dehydrogenase, mitochondrial precursor [Purpureocillium lavendulum]
MTAFNISLALEDVRPEARASTLGRGEPKRFQGLMSAPSGMCALAPVGINGSWCPWPRRGRLHNAAQQSTSIHPPASDRTAQHSTAQHGQAQAQANGKGRHHPPIRNPPILIMLASKIQRRAFSASARNLSKVAVLGAAGGIGQPLSLLLKMNTRVTDLALYDIRLGPGVAADVSHVNTKSTVKGYDPTPSGLAACLEGSDIVLIPAGVPRKPGMTRDDLFNTNASIVRDLAKAVAESAPKAKVLVISNPVNSTVPICAEIFKAKGVYNPKTLFGVTTLDVVRASRFVSEIKGTDPKDENITVVGGHSGVTIVPLFSQSSHPDLSSNAELVKRVQFGGDEVVKAKDGAGSATLSMAMAGARMADSLLRAADGEKGVTEPTFVDSPLYKDQGIDFFSSQVELGPNGVEKILPVGKVDANEEKLIEACLGDLKKNIEKGVAFVAQNPGK